MRWPLIGSHGHAVLLGPRVERDIDEARIRSHDRPVSTLKGLLARIGRGAAPLEPHAFESAIHLIPQPPASGPSITTVPTAITPITSTECARHGCGRPKGDPIHRIAED
jgi:hypothetical protein